MRNRLVLGELVLFVSYASNLGPLDANAGWDLYVHDLTTGLTSIVSAKDNEAGKPKGYSRWLGSATFSPDGSAIALSSTASDLVPDDGNGKGDVFLATVR